MTEPENDVQMFERWERSVEFRLFGDASDPTLTVPEQIATKVGDRVIAGVLPEGADLPRFYSLASGRRDGFVEIVVRKIAAQRPKDLLAVMREGVRRLGALADLADGGNAYAEMTYRLIVISARFSGNDRLRRMISALSLQTLRYSKLGLASVERRQRSVGLWQQSLLALEQGYT